MIKLVTFLILLAGLMLVACVGAVPGNTRSTPNASRTSNAMILKEPTASASKLTTIIAPRINIKTDRDHYQQGESIVIKIENNSASPIQFMGYCSLNQCYESGADWICEERECDGPMTVLESKSHLELLSEAKAIDLNSTAETNSKYKLDYQILSEDPFYFAHSNEFTVQSTGISCAQARQIAIEQTQSTPYWDSIDLSRVTVKWQGDNQACIVDFARQGAGHIRTGLWAEGYNVVLDAKSGRIIEANAYER